MKQISFTTKTAKANIRKVIYTIFSEKNIMLSFFLSFTSLVFSQKELPISQIPKGVKRTFDSIYAKDSIVKCKYTKSGVYVLTFKDNRKKTCVARFSSEGSWIETLRSLEPSEVPEKIRTETETVYHKAITIDYQQLIKADGNGHYLVSIMLEDKFHEIAYSFDGKFLTINTEEN